VPLPPEKRCALLVTNRYIPFSDADMMALMFLLRQGNRVMMCLESFPYALCDSLCFTTGSSQSRHSFFYGIEQYVAKGYTRDSLFFGTDTLHPEHVYEVYPPLHSRILRQSADVYYGIDSTRHDLNRIRCDSLEVLACDAAGDTVALRLFIGEGELFLVSTPLMFTNYGILDGGNASYAFRLLSYLKGMPLVRLEAGEAGETGRAGGTKTPLRYVLSQPPLRWALYASLVLIVIFMIFTARRRQRVIPVVRPPANETLRFTRLIGNLYYRKNDCKDILNKKYLYFSAELKRITGLDLQSDERDEALSRRLAEKTGQNSAIVWPAFRELKYLLRDEATVSESDMIHHIDRMNEWIGFLS
jgi:hypothetical protein